MVGNTLYYVMRWFDNPIEARIYFDTSVPQHRVALGVPPDWYRGFIEAFLDVIEPAADPHSSDEKATLAFPGDRHTLLEDLRREGGIRCRSLAGCG